MPFVDRAFLELLFSGRPEWREDTSIHRGLISSGNASLLSIRDSNTGAPIDAGPMSAFLLDKVNSVLKRMNVDGYRHYHRAQDWTRQRFLEAVDSVLLAPKSLDRGVLRESGVRTLLEDTRSGRADHSYVLQILLILELWQRGDES
jgi:hypothetical protein